MLRAIPTLYHIPFIKQLRLSDFAAGIEMPILKRNKKMQRTFRSFTFIFLFYIDILILISIVITQYNNFNLINDK